MQFVQALAAGVNEHHGDAVAIFRDALRTYKSGKSRALIENKCGASMVRFIFESLQKSHAEDYAGKAREELADSLYDGLEEELAIAALQVAWLAPLINERRPAAPETPVCKPAAEVPAVVTPREVLAGEPELALDEESDSCRLITT
jgi:hypothetical protein